MAGPRPAEERRRDALARLATPGLDGWVTTGSADGRAHLVPLSVGWTGERLVLATEPTARTTRNLAETGRARLGFGDTRDVVMIDAHVESSGPAPHAPRAILDAYTSQSGWDPRAAGADFTVHVLRPTRIQAWREADEIAGRTLMDDGEWLVD